MKLVHGHLWVDCYVWYSEERIGGAAARPGPSSLYQMDMFLFQLVCLFCLTVTAELLK